MAGDEAAMAEGGSLTLKQAAERLGLHYMTVYRHIRTGRLPARWVDGHWLVREQDLTASRAAGDPPALSGPRRRRPAFDEWSNRLERRLVAGDEAGAWTVGQSVLAAGASPDRVVLDVLAPAMVSVGRRWAAGELTVADEHRASQVATRVLARLGPVFGRPGRRRGAVLVGTPPGERHTLPVTMAVDLLRGAGHHVIDLGADVPAPMFSLVAERTSHLLAVAVGATCQGQLPALAEVVASVHDAVPGVPVLVGGAGVPDKEMADQVGADHWSGLDGRSLVAAVTAVDDARGRRPSGSGG